MPRVKGVSPCGVCVMGRFFVVSALMVLSCFTVVTLGMRILGCAISLPTAVMPETNCVKL